MKVQLCLFQRTAEDRAEHGLAFVKAFDLYDVHFIVDSNGQKLDYSQVHAYKLLSLLNVDHPYISTDEETEETADIPSPKENLTCQHEGCTERATVPDSNWPDGIGVIAWCVAHNPRKPKGKKKE